MAIFANKSLGQHFLTDILAIDRIVQTVADFQTTHAESTYVEIGPGLGAITLPLLKILPHLHLVELDARLASRLNRLASLNAKTTVHQVDILRFKLESLGSDLCVIGNLPYNISTQILVQLLELSTGILSQAFLMFQKEVAQRLIASPGSSAYGRLSVLTQLCAEVEPLFSLPPQAFKPSPKVDSMVVSLVPKLNRPHSDELKKVALVTRHAFSQRRKRLTNSLAKLFSAQQIEQLGIDGGQRPEMLPPAHWRLLANALMN